MVEGLYITSLLDDGLTKTSVRKNIRKKNKTNNFIKWQQNISPKTESWNIC